MIILCIPHPLVTLERTLIQRLLTLLGPWTPLQSDEICGLLLSIMQGEVYSCEDEEQFILALFFY